MKPIQIVMQAFGSYLGRTEIDFTRLGENPIFLITGATGGGKTTILDAMCFALYCKATGGRRSWSSMRCTAAVPESETLVEFTFQLGAESYRFTRSQKVYAARGTGVLKTKESHECFHLKDGTWELLRSGSEMRVRECAEELLGLTCEQFSQVMVLPQGDFLRLLLSNSRDKAQMFQTLFATGKWERVTRVLKEKANTLEKEADALTAARQAVLSREEVDSQEALQGKNCALQAEWKAQKEELFHAEEELQKRNAELSAAKSLFLQFREKREMEAETEKLLAQEPQMQQGRQCLERAHRAQGVHPYFVSFQASQRDLLAKERALLATQERSRQAETERKEAEAELPRAKELHALLEKLIKESGSLAGARERAVRCEEMQKTRRMLHQKVEQQEKREQAVQNQFETAAKRLTDGTEYIGHAREASRQLPVLLEKVQKLIQTNAAAALAQNLSDGAPCPVCGAVHHPSLAVMSNRLQQAQEEVAQAKKQADLLESAEKRLEQRRAELEKVQQELSACREESARLHSEGSGIVTGLQELLKSLDGQTNLKEIEQKLRDTEKKIQEYTHTAEKLEQRANAAQSAAVGGQTAVQAANNAFIETKSEKEMAQKKLLEELALAGLSPDTDCAAWVLSASEISELEKTLRSYDTAVRSAQERLTRLQAELAGKEEPELVAIESAQLAAQEWVRKTAQQNGILQQTQESIKKSLHRLKELDEKGKQIEEEYSRTSRLAVLLSGKNAMKIPIQQFVLGIMLDDILSCANQFFATLSSGRYSLSRVTGASGGNALGGLDIQVFDAYSGGVRAVETLSGGELFLASLSLAFGLSDVVQNYSGSVRLDSIFIDEGFGSLDQDTLDTAMKALAQLQSMGRTIGMISHVSELKSRIAAQIVVHKAADGGSTAEVRFG